MNNISEILSNNYNNLYFLIKQAKVDEIAQSIEHSIEIIQFQKFTTNNIVNINEIMMRIHNKKIMDSLPKDYITASGWCYS